MSRRAWVLMVALLCSCDDDESSHSGLDGGGHDAVTVSDAGIDVADAADANPNLGSPACFTPAQGLVGKAIMAAQIDLSCATDDDCLFVETPTACTYSCGALFNQRGLASVLPTIAAIAAEYCPAFVQQGCLPVRVPCPPPFEVACVTDTCKPFPPAQWSSFAVLASAGQSLSIPPSCAPGEECTIWSLTPDGVLTKNLRGLTSKPALTPGDFATVDGILRSMDFRTKEMAGFACGPRPTKGGFAFALGRSRALTGFDVSGCVAAGPDNDPARLVKILTAY